jgi:hypothetical protein
MANFPTSGTCPNCSYTGELRDVSPGDLLGVAGRAIWKAFTNPFGTAAGAVSGLNNPTYNGTHWCCPKCNHRLIECNTCHTINLDRTKTLGEQADCRSCGKRIS